LLCVNGRRAIEQTALSIKPSAQGFGKALLEIFQGASTLKRAYEFWFCCKTDSGLVEVAFVPTADSPPHLVHELKHPFK